MNHHEDHHQAALVAWMNLQPELVGRFFHPANGGKRNVREARRLKYLGVMAGVSDIFVCIPNKYYHGLFLELKAPYPNAGRVTKEQAGFIQRMNDSGYLAVVCYGWDVARERIIDYMQSTKKG